MVRRTRASEQPTRAAAHAARAAVPRARRFHRGGQKKKTTRPRPAKRKLEGQKAQIRQTAKFVTLKVISSNLGNVVRARVRREDVNCNLHLSLHGRHHTPGLPYY